VTILHFPPRSKTPPPIATGIMGLYFYTPPAQQARRRRELAAAGFPPDLIRELCRAGAQL
jgi:hypothetical protein